MKGLDGRDAIAIALLIDDPLLADRVVSVLGDVAGVRLVTRGEPADVVLVSTGDGRDVANASEGDVASARETALTTGVAMDGAMNAASGKTSEARTDATSDARSEARTASSDARSAPADDGSSGAGALLTRREREVLALLAEGASNKTIARTLGISVHTAKFHVGSLLDKLDATGRTHAVTHAARRGVIEL